MNAETIAAIFAVLTGLFGLATTYLRTKQNEAYAQGDLVIDKFGQATKALLAVSTVYAPLAPIAKEAAEAQKALKTAWDDPKVTTADFMILCDRLADLVKAGEALAQGIKKA